MNVWENAVITTKGLALQAKLIEGTTLRITRAVTGSGFVTPGLLQQQTSVSGETQPLTFRPVSYPEEGKCKITCDLSNEEVKTGYTAMQVGIYADDPDEGEILYFITQAESGTGTIIPSATEMPGYSAEWSFYFQFGHADDVTVLVDEANKATIEMLEGKADIDFGNVTNVVFLEKAIVSGAAIPIVIAEGDGTHYTASVPGMDTLKNGMTFIMRPSVTSKTTMPTLNVNGLGQLNLRQELSINNAATVPGTIPTWLSAGFPCMVSYDGSLWKVLVTRPAANSIYGVVPIANGGTGADNAEDALNNIGAASENDVAQLKSKLERLESAIYDDITGNPHNIDFIDLEGLVVTGIWNEAKARMEC